MFCIENKFLNPNNIILSEDGLPSRSPYERRRMALSMGIFIPEAFILVMIQDVMDSIGS